MLGSIFQKGKKKPTCFFKSKITAEVLKVSWHTPGLRLVVFRLFIDCATQCRCHRSDATQLVYSGTKQWSWPRIITWRRLGHSWPNMPLTSWRKIRDWKPWSCTGRLTIFWMLLSSCLRYSSPLFMACTGTCVCIYLCIYKNKNITRSSCLVATVCFNCTMLYLLPTDSWQRGQEKNQTPEGEEAVCASSVVGGKLPRTDEDLTAKQSQGKEVRGDFPLWLSSACSCLPLFLSVTECVGLGLDADSFELCPAKKLLFFVFVFVFSLGTWVLLATLMSVISGREAQLVLETSGPSVVCFLS